MSIRLENFRAKFRLQNFGSKKLLVNLNLKKILIILNRKLNFVFIKNFCYRLFQIITNITERSKYLNIFMILKIVMDQIVMKQIFDRFSKSKIKISKILITWFEQDRTFDRQRYTMHQILLIETITFVKLNPYSQNKIEIWYFAKKFWTSKLKKSQGPKILVYDWLTNRKWNHKNFEKSKFIVKSKIQKSGND